MSKLDKLKELRSLFDDGVLTEEEFELEKNKILDNTDNNTSRGSNNEIYLNENTRKKKQNSGVIAVIFIAILTLFMVSSLFSSITDYSTNINNTEDEMKPIEGDVLDESSNPSSLQEVNIEKDITGNLEDFKENMDDWVELNGYEPLASVSLEYDNSYFNFYVVITDEWYTDFYSSEKEPYLKAIEKTIYSIAQKNNLPISYGNMNIMFYDVDNNLLANLLSEGKFRILK